jgi:hypothetical protein
VVVINSSGSFNSFLREIFFSAIAGNSFYRLRE